ncbi:MAG: CpaF family protein [bacterium]|nr:CpaF family protein [bacterium]
MASTGAVTAAPAAVASKAASSLPDAKTEPAPKSVSKAPAKSAPRAQAAPISLEQRRAQKPPRKDDKMQELKFRIHSRLFEVLDLARADEMTEESNGDEVVAATQKILTEEGVALTKDERQRLLREIKDEVFGLGPIEPLLREPGVCDILVNGPKQIYVERAGRLELTSARFRDDAHLLRIIERVVSQMGRRIDESNPMVDARLEDGSRVNAIIAPLALDGPSMSIRRFPSDSLDHEDMIRLGSMTPELVATLRAAVQLALNIIVSGGTGSGKTTLLNILSSFIPEDQRIVTIEDSAELQLRQEHVVRLETRPANLEGRGQIGQRELLVNTLRMRPDRIIVGECRAGEALDMLQAMNTGHDGSLTTVHANTPRDALSRLEVMVAMSGIELPRQAVRAQIASAVDIVIQQQRLSDGNRKVTSVQEIVGLEGEVVTMQEIFTLERDGVAEDGTVLARLVPTGVRPKFVEKLEQEGIELPDDLFKPAASDAAGQG